MVHHGPLDSQLLGELGGALLARDIVVHPEVYLLESGAEPHTHTHTHTHHKQCVGEGRCGAAIRTCGGGTARVGAAVPRGASGLRWAAKWPAVLWPVVGSVVKVALS